MLYGSPSLQGLPEPGHTTIAIISQPVQPRSRCANTEDTDVKTCKTTKPGSTFGATQYQLHHPYKHMQAHVPGRLLCNKTMYYQYTPPDCRNNI